jgi:hypothetical protein
VTDFFFICCVFNVNWVCGLYELLFFWVVLFSTGGLICLFRFFFLVPRFDSGINIFIA